MRRSIGVVTHIRLPVIRREAFFIILNHVYGLATINIILRVQKNCPSRQFLVFMLLKPLSK